MADGITINLGSRYYYDDTNTTTVAGGGAVGAAVDIAHRRIGVYGDFDRCAPTNGANVTIMTGLVPSAGYGSASGLLGWRVSLPQGRGSNSFPATFGRQT